MSPARQIIATVAFTIAAIPAIVLVFLLAALAVTIVTAVADGFWHGFTEGRP